VLYPKVGPAGLEPTTAAVPPRAVLYPKVGPAGLEPTTAAV
jgi:hypothetical protein